MPPALDGPFIIPDLPKRGVPKEAGAWPQLFKVLVVEVVVVAVEGLVAEEGAVVVVVAKFFRLWP